MGPNKKPSASLPKPSSSSSIPPPSDDITAAKQAVVALQSGSYGKAKKIIKEALSKHNDSPILHRINASIHLELASLLNHSNPAKLKQLEESAQSAHVATTLSPNSLSLSRFYVFLLLELSKLNKEYDNVIQECHRGLSIKNPIDSLNDGLIEERDLNLEGKKLSLESRIENVRNDIVKYKNTMNIVKILDVDDVDGGERIRYRPSNRSKIDSDLKGMIIKKNEEVEKKIKEMMSL